MTSTKASTGPTRPGEGRYIGEAYGMAAPPVKGVMPMWRESKDGPVLVDVQVAVSQYTEFGPDKFKNWDEYLVWLIEQSY